MTQSDRITLHPALMGGKPCVRGIRVTVGTIVGQIDAGRMIEEVLTIHASSVKMCFTRCATLHGLGKTAKLPCLAHAVADRYESVASVADTFTMRGGSRTLVPHRSAKRSRL
jgi:hypothetical protein